jgi:hypothetical protein
MGWPQRHVSGGKQRSGQIDLEERFSGYCCIICVFSDSLFLDDAVET